MPMKIEGADNVCDIFSIFHDGTISESRSMDGEIVLTVEIPYLAKRINPSFEHFQVTLLGVKKLKFSTWPSDLKSEPELLTEAEKIFAPHLEILEGNIREGRIEVVCNQHSEAFGYCGGELSFEAQSAEVADEAGKSYSIGELGEICEAYWNAWENEETRA